MKRVSAEEITDDEKNVKCKRTCLYHSYSLVTYEMGVWISRSAFQDRSLDRSEKKSGMVQFDRCGPMRAVEIDTENDGQFRPSRKYWFCFFVHSKSELGVSVVSGAIRRLSDFL